MTRTFAPGRDSAGFTHEQLHLALGPRSGIPIAIGIHSTTRGAAIGGCRLSRYADWRSGVEDALGLSEAMSLKCALAKLPHGGGKTVAMLPAEPLTPEWRSALIADIAEQVGLLGGRYITGPDVGSTPEDMAVIHERTGGFAFCRPEQLGGSGNSSAATARGVLAALHAGIRHVFHTDPCAGLRVGIVGLGSVGRLVAKALVAAGARVVAADANPDVRRVAEALNCGWADIDAVHERIDVLVPAATGGLLTQAATEACRARLIVGPANNQLAADSIADELHARGIVWVPDIVASGGGIIHAVCREEFGLDEHATNARIDAIGEQVSHILLEAQTNDISTLRAAHDLAAATTNGTTERTR